MIYCRLEYEQSHLLERITDLVQKFDAELLMLRHEKFQMDIIMTNADLRYVLCVCVCVMHVSCMLCNFVF